jgi:hypothetical protein
MFVARDLPRASKAMMEAIINGVATPLSDSPLLLDESEGRYILGLSA